MNTVEPPPTAPPANSPNTPTPGSSPHSADTPPSPSLAEAAKAHDAFLKGEKPPGQNQPPPKQPSKQQQPPPPKKDAPAPTDLKPTKKEAPKEAPKRALDGILPKDELPDKGKTDTPPDDENEIPKDQKRWKELKEIEKRYQEDSTKWKDFETREAKYKEDLAAREKDSQELAEYRRVRDFTDVTKSERYIKDVATPFDAIQDIAIEVADYGQVELRDLMRAMSEPNTFKREEAVRAVVEKGKNEIKPATIALLVEKGDQLKGIYAKMQQYQQEATLQKEQHETAQKADKLRVDTETRAMRDAARKEVRDTLKVRAGDVITDEMLEQAFKAAETPSDDPMDAEFRGMAERLVPSLITLVRDLQRQLEERTKQEDEERATQPGVRPDPSKTDGKANPYSSLSEATQKHREVGGRF
jgi:hypothetical protein